MASLAEKPYDLAHVSRNVKIHLILLFLKALFCQLTVTLHPDFINFSMAEQTTKQSRFKRLTNRYRLVVMNDHTYEEVVTFKLTRLSVYIASCFVFVMLVALTTALISFTPLKYYVPGYGSQSERRADKTQVAS